MLAFLLMNKLLFIVGPTATGKTDLAISFAKKLDGELVSADSRQVFRGMDIGTGKDLTSKETIDRLQLKVKFRQKQYSLVPYRFHNVPLWMVDVANPDEDFSISHYHALATRVIADIYKAKKTAIVVGGTGLYIKSLRLQLNQINIPPNKDLRKKLDKLTIEELQASLKKIGAEKFSQMNHSDQFNPRRLIRAIEMVMYKKEHKGYSSSDSGEVPEESRSYQKNTKDSSRFANALSNNNTLLMGLSTSRQELFRRIDQRVEKRVQQGIITEIENLVQAGYSLDLPAMSATGYRVWKEYFSGKKTQAETITLWKKEEHDYAKRQMTWFKKEPGINWFDISQPAFKSHISQSVEKWYNQK